MNTLHVLYRATIVAKVSIIYLLWCGVFLCLAHDIIFPVQGQYSDGVTSGIIFCSGCIIFQSHYQLHDPHQYSWLPHCHHMGLAFCAGTDRCPNFRLASVFWSNRSMVSDVGGVAFFIVLHRTFGRPSGSKVLVMDENNRHFFPASFLIWFLVSLIYELYYFEQQSVKVNPQ